MFYISGTSAETYGSQLPDNGAALEVLHQDRIYNADPFQAQTGQEFEVTIDTFGAVGEEIIGIFSGYVIEEECANVMMDNMNNCDPSDPGNSKTITNGTIRVTREADWN